MKGFPWIEFSKLYLCWWPASFSSPGVRCVFSVSGTHQQVVSHHLPCAVPLGLDTDLYWDYTQQTPPFLFFCLRSWMWHLLGAIISVSVGFHALCIGPWLESGNGYSPCTLKSTHTPQSFASNFWSSQTPWSQSMVSKLIISSLYYKL